MPSLSVAHSFARTGRESGVLALKLFLLLVVGAGCLNEWAGADERPAGDPAAVLVMEPADPGARLRGLALDRSRMSLVSRGRGRNTRYFAEIQGHFTRPEWTLVFGRTRTPTERKSGSFKVWIPVRRNSTWVRLAAVSDDGSVETENIKILCPSLEAIETGRIALHPSLKFRVAMGLGYASYHQTDAPAVSEETLRLEISALQKFAHSPWQLKGNAWVTAFAMANEGGPALGLVNLDATLDYVVNVGSRWSFGLGAGPYYATSYSTAELGFRNLMGPEAAPSISYCFANQTTLQGDLRYAFLDEGIVSSGPGNGEAAGVRVSYGDFAPGTILEGWRFMIDFSELSFRLGASEGNYSQEILGVAYSL